FARADAQAQYTMFLEALAGHRARIEDFRDPFQPHTQAPIYDIGLISCAAEEYLFDEIPRDSRAGFLLQLAYDESAIRQVLTTLGYPSSLWNDMIAGYPQQEIRVAASMGFDMDRYDNDNARVSRAIPSDYLRSAIVPRLDAFQKNHPSLPRVEVQG